MDSSNLFSHPIVHETHTSDISNDAVQSPVFSDSDQKTSE
jgi:hypothetical protein